MREHSEFELWCLCGCKIVSRSRDVICPACNVSIRVDWGQIDEPEKQGEPEASPH